MLIAVILLFGGCGSLSDLLTRTEATRSAKLPVPACPPETLQFDDEGWVARENMGQSLSPADFRQLETWVLGWQKCAKQRGAVIDQANR